MFWRIWHILTQSFPPAPKWDAGNIPDQTNRVHLVTGGAAGIGRETVKALLKRNATVYIAARNPTKARETITQLVEETGREAHYLELDLASLDSVQRAAQEFLRLGKYTLSKRLLTDLGSREHELHVLYNNAGVMFANIELLTEDGYDLQFGTNVVGHFYLTQLLLPALLRGKARIITVSSIATIFLPIPPMDLNALRVGPRLRKNVWFGTTAGMYSLSKLGNVLHAKELHRRYRQDGIVSIALNPGNINTKLYRYTYSWFRWLIKKLFLHPVGYGALTQLYAGTAPEAVAFSGQVLVPWARAGIASAKGNDPVLAKQLWEWLEEQVNIHESR